MERICLDFFYNIMTLKILNGMTRIRDFLGWTRLPRL
jgi:hypothetical protein